MPRPASLVECGTKALIGAVFDSFAVGERTLAWRLLVHLHTGMPLMADRGFPAFDLWRAAADTGTQLLWRALDSFALPVDRVLWDGTIFKHNDPADQHICPNVSTASTDGTSRLVKRR